MKLLPIFGTGGGDFTLDGSCANPADHWWHYKEGGRADTPLWGYLRGLGCEPFRCDREFKWSGDIDGLGRLVKPWLWFRRAAITYRDWEAGADALINYVDGRRPPIGDEAWIALCHSHGGQVALYAAAFGLRIPILITVGTPHRADLLDVTLRARSNIGRWVHVFDADCDEIAQAGQLADGTFSFQRQQPHADANLALRHVQHSLILRDPALFAYWPAILKTAAESARPAGTAPAIGA